ncbi:MAG: PKD domain-containing protein, partial [Flavobacteriales bacterium]|nr:PKD domain-containing protein [Flavobacteriales bacterium]
MMKKIGLKLLVIFMTIAGLHFSAEAQKLYYSISQTGDSLRLVNPANTTVLKSVPITLAGKTIDKANGLAIHPTNGTVYALLNIAAQTGRELAIIDTATGVATSVGNTGAKFAGITFNSTGTLYAISGDGATIGETLYTLSLSNALPSLALTLGNGDDGEAIAYNSDDGKIYHASGLGTIVFESITLPSTVSNITYSGVTLNEPTALYYDGGGNFIWVSWNNWFNITSTGVVSNLTGTAFLFNTKGIIPATGGGGCPLAVATSSTDESTVGANDGTATATPFSGTPPYTYLWSNFATTATITGLSPGTYTVVVTDATGCTASGSVTILPGAGGCPTPTALFTSTSTGLNANFFDGSLTTPPANYFWDFGDGFASGVQNPAHTYPSPGTYTVCLTVTDSCGTNSLCQIITIVGGGCPTPTAAFTSTSVGLTATFLDGSTANGAATYLWDFSDGFTSTLQNPSHTYSFAATYNVCLTVTDSCGTATICQNVSVTAGACPTPTAAYTYTVAGLDVSFNDGSTVTGTASYFWDFGDGTTLSAQNPANLYSAAGTYNVCLTVTDTCGSATICQLITVGGGGCPTPTTAFASTSVGLDATFIDGSTTSGPATYAWDFGDGATSTLQSPAHTYGTASTYNVCLTVTDSCGFSTLCQIITVTGGCTLSLIQTSSDESTPGAFDGMASVFTTGGTAPFTYLWDDPSTQTNSVATGLTAGVYTVTVTDASGCVEVATVVVSVIGCNLTSSTTSTDETSAGANDGTASVAVSGGTLPYTYAWSNGATTSSQTGMAPGSYTVVITDAAGCLVLGSVVIQAAGGCTLTVNAASTNETLAGMNDGTATAAGSNGTQPYTYTWSTGQNTSAITNLPPGTYTVMVSDANMCTATTTVTILSGGVNCQLQVSVSATNESSIGGNDGTATANATNGTAPLTYQWSSGQSTSFISGLAPAVYSCTVTDADGCTAIGQAIVQAFQCTMSGSVTSTDESGIGTMDGSATVAITGGNGPFTFLWDDVFTQTTSTATGLGFGFYNVLVTDADGCTYNGSAAINTGGLGCNLTATITGTHESQAGANNGSATVTVSGGTAVSIIWMPGGQITNTITGLSPGDYTVNITDSLGCIAAATFTVNPGFIIGVYEQVMPTIEVSVYPNPAVDLINFEMTDFVRGILYIYDIAGRIIQDIDITEKLTEVSTAELGSGLYFYQLLDTNGKKLDGGKFEI